MKLFAGLLIGASMLVSAAAMAITTANATGNVAVTVEQYCYVRNADTGNGQFDITIAGSDIESDSARGADTVVFNTFANFGYDLTATLNAPVIETAADTLAELPAGSKEEVTWKMAVDGMALEDITAFGNANDVVYAGGPNAQRVTPGIVKTVPVQLELSKVGMLALATAEAGHTYNGTVTLTLNPKF